MSDNQKNERGSQTRKHIEAVKTTIKVLQSNFVKLVKEVKR
jgi:hypothetical protein